MDGGNSFMALAYLARWGGPVNESPTTPTPTPSHPTGLGAQRQSERGRVRAGRTASRDNDEIKAAVMEYGAVDVGMWWPTLNAGAALEAVDRQLLQRGRRTTPTTTSPSSAGTTPTRRASSPPPRPATAPSSCGTAGASSWAGDGYFYVSYFDGCLARDGYNMAFVSAGPTDQYSRVYQYDPLGYFPLPART